MLVNITELLLRKEGVIRRNARENGMNDEEIEQSIDFLKPVRVYKGIYEHRGFSLNFREKQSHDLDYPRFENFSCYGVCDSWQQLLEKLPLEVKEGPIKYVIGITSIKKYDQEEEGGWRWHKWGPYIGIQQPTREYLRDEPLIEEVFVYQIYQVGEYTHEKWG